MPEHNQDIVVVPQILTNKSEDFIKVAQMMGELGYKEVNLNLGCPSGTVVSKKKGSGFLSDLDGMKAFFDEVFSGSEPSCFCKDKTWHGEARRNKRLDLSI